MPMRIGATLASVAALVAVVAICAPATLDRGLAAVRQHLAPEVADGGLLRLTSGAAIMPSAAKHAAATLPARCPTVRATYTRIIVLRVERPRAA